MTDGLNRGNHLTILKVNTTLFKIQTNQKRYDILYIYIYAYMHTCIFVVVNFDALAQASDIRIERRQVVFFCWMQVSNPRSQTPIRQKTECLLANRLSYRGSSYLKLELDSPSLWSASIQPTRPHCQLAFAPGSGDIHIWHTYIHTYIHTYTHTYIYIHIHTYIHSYIHTYIHTYMFVVAN